MVTQPEAPRSTAFSTTGNRSPTPKDQTRRSSSSSAIPTALEARSRSRQVARPSIYRRVRCSTAGLRPSSTHKDRRNLGQLDNGADPFAALHHLERLVDFVQVDAARDHAFQVEPPCPPQSQQPVEVHPNVRRAVVRTLDRLLHEEQL